MEGDEREETRRAEGANGPSSPAPQRARRRWAWPALLVAGLVIVAFRAGLGLDRRAVQAPTSREAAGGPAGAAPADPALEGLGRSLAALRVRTVKGDVVAAAPPGEASVVMVSSVTCGYCERSLRDLVAMAGGGPLPGLRVVTLEGAGPGGEMLERLGVRGAVSTGPVGSSEQVLLTFRIPGTPVFASVDSTGRLVEVVPGYPGPEGLAPLYRVMARQ